MSVATVRYAEPNLGPDVEIVVPTTWSALSRANAICQLQYGWPMTEWLAVLACVRCSGDRKVAADLLLTGWSPHEKVTS